jgi:hypothetical protein
MTASIGGLAWPREWRLGAVSPDSARSCRLAYEPKPGFFVERPGSAIFLTGVTDFTPPAVKAFYKDRRFAEFLA